MREEYDRFLAQDFIIFVIGPEGPRRFKKVWEEEQYPFIGFPDYKHKVADLYGQKVKLLKLGRMPAIIIVDKQGLIRYVHFGDDMADIPKNEDLLTVLEE